MPSCTGTWRRVALALAGVVLASACGSTPAGDEGDPGPAGPTSGAPADEADAPLATLDLVDDDAEFRAVSLEAFEPAADDQPLTEGDAVRTDLTGFAVVDWLDGSQTRLDRATEFEVVALAGSAEAPMVRARLDIGRAWNNVSGAAADGEFVIETEVATATVRGTIFLVECLLRTVCSFAVVEGEVEVATTAGRLITLTAGQEVTVTAVDDGGVEPAETAEAGRDDYVDRNRALDAGEADPGDDGDAQGSVPSLRVLEPIGDILEAGDIIPLGYLEGAFVAPGDSGCPDQFHVHAQTAEGITILGQGPFPDDEGCGYGLTVNWTVEGPIAPSAMGA